MDLPQIYLYVPWQIDIFLINQQIILSWTVYELARDDAFELVVTRGTRAKFSVFLVSVGEQSLTACKTEDILNGMRDASGNG